ncbi:MAG: ferrous iron transport protein A [Clostridia bacterium]|nr:ferrous iron transport protein A [Clostridia bacterium]
MKKIGDKCVLSDLVVGQKAKVLKLNETDKVIRRHLLDMGIVRGTTVTVKKIAPMGDPIDIKLRDYELCICKNDLSKIEVEVVG